MASAPPAGSLKRSGKMIDSDTFLADSWEEEEVGDKEEEEEVEGEESVEGEEGEDFGESEEEEEGEEGEEEEEAEEDEEVAEAEPVSMGQEKKKETNVFEKEEEFQGLLLQLCEEIRIERAEIAGLPIEEPQQTPKRARDGTWLRLSQLAMLREEASESDSLLSGSN